MRRAHLVLSRARRALAAGLALAFALSTSSGCSDPGQAATTAERSPLARAAHAVKAGTTIEVILGSTISTESASVGDEWSGRLADDVRLQDGGTLPAGTRVNGLIQVAVGAGRGSRAMLDLVITGIAPEGRSESLTANGEPQIASAPRGASFAGADAASDEAAAEAEQVVLEAGTTLSFWVAQTATIR